MPFIHELRQVSAGALLSLVIDVLPLLMAVLYAIRPTERRLAFMRPLSLAAIFAGLGGMIGGLAVILRGISATQNLTTHALQMIALGLSEALIPLYIAFGCLTVAWLLVGLGMRREH